MSGLDHIIESILKAAKADADEILRTADEEVGEIQKAAERTVAEIEENAKDQIARETEKQRQMAESADKQNRRQTLLRAKIEMINTVLDAAKAEIAAMPTDEYFAMLYQIFVNQHITADGEIYFSAIDKKRLPADFIERLNSVGGGKITLADSDRNIENGFIVRCGKIEINCTIASLMEEKDSILRDRLQQYLSEE